jgi:hypothetical protein
MLSKLVEKFADYCEREETRQMLQAKLLDPMVRYMVSRLWNYIVALLTFLTCHLLVLAWLLFKVSSLRRHE